MTKILVPVVCFLILTISGCKKDSGSDNNNPDQISAKDPVALSKSLKIWHAVHVKGATPVPTGGSDAPSVFGPENGKIQAFAGKYAVINPTVMSGTVAGYYVGIAGAGEYFKLDYSKTRLAERPFNKKKKLFGRPMGDEDSSIVIVLPPNIQTPDSFCITYCPYDSLGNIGQPITTCIILNTLGGDASTSWFIGNWRMYGQTADNATNPSDLYIYKYNASNVYQYSDKYYCETDNSGSSYISSYCFDSTNCSLLAVSDSTNYIKNDFVINDNGSWIISQLSYYKTVDITNSDCNSYRFTTNTDSQDITGGWSISGNKLILIYDFLENGVDDSDAFEFAIEKISDREFRLIDTVSNSGDTYIIFRKL